VLAEQLACENFARLERSVISTITGATLCDQEDLRALLCRQMTSPVQFAKALAALLGGAPSTRDTVGQMGHVAGEIDLLIEVGPGKVLSGLVKDTTEVPVVALDAGGTSLRGLLQAAGAAFALGATVRTEVLFADRFSRPFSLASKPKFFGNPCELAPLSAESESRTAELGQSQLPSAAAAPGTRVQQMPAIGAQKPSANSALSALEWVRQLVAERAELPAATVLDHHRMLSDLHLNSITVGQLVSEAARHLGLSRVLALTDFANASVAEMARALEELKQVGSGPRTEDSRRQPPGVDLWTETFTVDLVESPRPAPPSRAVTNHESPVSQRHPSATTPAGWQVFAPADHPFAFALKNRLNLCEAGGVLLCLPEHPDEEHVCLVLAAARAVSAPGGSRRFVLVQHGWGAAGFARTLHLETPGLTTCVVNVPPACLSAVDWIAAEVASAAGYTEAHYDEAGGRREPRLSLASNLASGEAASAYPIGREDVLLVTGGGKGIAAESSLALARATSASLALMGRSDPAVDKQLAENLARIAAAGVRCAYVRADVTDARAVQGAVAEAELRLGPVTALLHGAGSNTPQLISALDEEAIQRTLAPKIRGLRNVLAALDPNRLRLLITFGSIIARAGLRGEADYALANEWLTALTEDFQARHPGCRCLALEWSVWSGMGMGERLGRVDSLILQGIMPIHPDEGVRILLECLRHPQPATALVVTGRFGEPATLKLTQPDLPLQRFLERRRAYYPGVELVVDAELSRQTDPYLDDHVVHKERLLPAVLGLEGMAQVAMALTGSRTPPSFEHVELTRPIAVSEKGTTTIRLAALRRGPGLVEVCLRSEVTDYHVDHFRCLCRFEHADAKAIPIPGYSPLEALRLPLEPERDLYGRILFHRGRFRRLQGYRLLRAKECIAEIGPDDATPWFGPYLPGEFLLGNPAARDAALHAIQACIPHRRLLPTGIDQLVIHRIESGQRIVWARERSREGNNFIYDLQVTNPGGELIENWDGLRLRAVEELPPPESWPPALLGPYLERRLEELVPGSSLAVGVESCPSLKRSAGSVAAQRRALGRIEHIFRRPDGKRVTLKHESLSAAHTRNLTLAVAGAGVVACDVEEVIARSGTVWGGLLGSDRHKLAERISRERPEDLNTAATRLWTAFECMKKAALSPEAPLVLDSITDDGWVLFRSGGLTIATCVAFLSGTEAPLAIGLALNHVVNGAQALPAVQTLATEPE
jgi:enediyne polyketide synthase